MSFLNRLALTQPIVQAPMAGVSTPALAASVSEAGGLGSLGLGAGDAAAGRAAIAAVQERTNRAFSVNLFVHRPAQAYAAREAAWIEALAPLFAEFGAAPPVALREIYTSFAADEAMLRMLVETRPPAVSFHFGVPSQAALSALRAEGILLMATATNLMEAEIIARAGIDVIVAQGIEAGGHRGVFDPVAADDGLSTLALTPLLARKVSLPVIAAGGIMDGAGIAAALDLGAAAAQLGTAFVACPESAAHAGYRRALTGPGAYHTVVTSLISGRPARALANRFTGLTRELGDRHPPDYPIAYDAGKALHAAAKARGEYGFGAHWAGQGAPLIRTLPAAELVAVLAQELAATRHAKQPHTQQPLP
jgi:nitronate monooxygenase